MDLFKIPVKVKTKSPQMILYPTQHDLSNLQRYVADNKSVRNALAQYGVLKVIPPSTWSYQFNDNIHDLVFNGKNSLLSFYNVETLDKLSFKRFYHLFMNAEKVSWTDLVDIPGVDLYSLYKTHFGCEKKWKDSDQLEHVRQTCTVLGLGEDVVEKVCEVIEKFLTPFHEFLCSKNKVS